MTYSAGRFGEPEHLGPSVNSAGDEFALYLFSGILVWQAFAEKLGRLVAAAQGDAS